MYDQVMLLVIEGDISLNSILPTMIAQARLFEPESIL